MEENQVCYTFDAAVEKAIEMEEEGFRNYLAAIRKVTNKGAREILRENALDELEHKHQLEKALLEGRMEGEAAFSQTIPTMHLDYTLKKQELGPESGVREALIYAIHLEKGAVDFYGKVANGCAGAPMGNLFGQLLKEESRHLQALEDLYERHFMTEN
ncbi:ferritin family protein [Geobacter sp. SVR]|uniref:ferritin-like domain-containing protein n=1 Tax=Geobacter sp. SVR TaxID=2495594 RepID=UPI00143EFE91|nr:ferritin family protein [Geobacter sp. SVR]BCS52447.1 ferritin [Geobacter sp. SVR]GCF87322.1 ferritin [Geobacter sp. SVR]